jgi:hypothetical protein
MIGESSIYNKVWIVRSSRKMTKHDFTSIYYLVTHSGKDTGKHIRKSQGGNNELQERSILNCHAVLISFLTGGMYRWKFC